MTATTESPALSNLVDSARVCAQAATGSLQTLKLTALARHKALGIPTTHDEEWRFTPLRDALGHTWKPAEPGLALFSTGIPNLSGSPLRVVLVNGRLDRNLSDIGPVPGLTVASLSDMVLQEPQLLEGRLGRIADTEGNTFAALSTALFEDGVYIRFAAHAEVNVPVEVVHISSAPGQAVATRTLIVAEANSRGTVIESYRTDGESASLTLPVTEVYVGPDARLEHVRVQDESDESFHIGLWEVMQEKASEYRSCNVAFGSRLARLDQNIDLQGRHVVSRLDGVVVATGKQVLDNHTNLDHALPDGNSFEIYKQIIGDEASVVFNGKIYVHQDAQKTDAKQTNQALLLSPKATINSKPQLEIFADDVKCTHGATVGQLEDEPLFYLMSRGMPRQQAEAVLVYAFAAEVLELIENEPVRSALEARLFDKLGLA